MADLFDLSTSEAKEEAEAEALRHEMLALAELAGLRKLTSAEALRFFHLIDLTEEEWAEQHTTTH
jgi:hypothetical protein